MAGVLVAIGDTVKPDDPIVELETDKAVIEVPSGEAGVVKSLTIEVGETVTVGQVIATINLGEAQAKETPPAMVVATDSSIDSTLNRPEIPPPPSSSKSKKGSCRKSKIVSILKHMRDMDAPVFRKFIIIVLLSVVAS